MSDKPILFSGEMVRAVLRDENPKTQTRRVIKQNPPEGFYAIPLPTGVWAWEKGAKKHLHVLQAGVPFACPYGKAVDRLWVRETFAVESNFNLDSEERYPPPFSDGRPIRRVDDEEFGQYWEQCHYRATDAMPYLVDTNTDNEVGWKPSIHMPRWASRITLEIVNVRVERVQKIGRSGIRAEGIDFESLHRLGMNESEHTCAGLDAFKNLWNRINEKRGFGWDKNPWVWVIEFKRLQPA